MRESGEEGEMGELLRGVIVCIYNENRVVELS